MESVKQGDRFEVLQDLDVSGLTHWRAPFTGDFRCTLRSGTILIADIDPIADAPGFHCVPQDYRKLQRKLVPWRERWRPFYAGYSFVFLKSDIGVTLRRLSSLPTV